jgi:DAACS family dicarboxylate/amino acid:cation (Na+ or H+) symporter
LEPNGDPPRDELVARRIPLHAKILIGLVVGATAGLAANVAGTLGADRDGNGLADWLDASVYWVEAVGKIFLRLMFMVVLPLVFSALSLAVVEIGDVRKLGRLGLRTLVYTAILSGTAVLIGLALVNTVQPGRSLPDELRDRIIRQEEESTDKRVRQATGAKPIRDSLWERPSRFSPRSAPA